ncbi:unnamed protein product [Closterium sp. NIES-53]
MHITIHLIVTTLPDRLAGVCDALLWKHPSALTIEVLEKSLKDIERNIRFIASASITRKKGGKGGGGGGGEGGGRGSGGTSATSEGSTGGGTGPASRMGGVLDQLVDTQHSSSSSPSRSSHNRDNSGSKDTVAAGSSADAAAVSADHRSSTTLPCPAVRSGVLTVLHIPSFSKNLVERPDFTSYHPSLDRSPGSPPLPSSKLPLLLLVLLLRYTLPTQVLPRQVSLPSVARDVSSPSLQTSSQSLQQPSALPRHVAVDSEGVGSVGARAGGAGSEGAGAAGAGAAGAGTGGASSGGARAGGAGTGVARSEGAGAGGTATVAPSPPPTATRRVTWLFVDLSARSKRGPWSPFLPSGPLTVSYFIPSFSFCLIPGCFLSSFITVASSVVPHTWAIWCPPRARPLNLRRCVSPSQANVVDGMWIFKVSRPSGLPHMFKALYVARGFNQCEGVDFF